VSALREECERIVRVMPEDWSLVRLAKNTLTALDALDSIAGNTCCDRCQEAALVARAALAKVSA
jgi:hypothetical protein